MAKQLYQPFEHEEKPTAATKRQQEIVTSLDISKNQASAKIDEAGEQAVDVTEEKPQRRIGAQNNAAIGVVV